MSLSYSILITGSQNGQETLHNVAEFIKSCLKQEHTIDRVFLYSDAVYSVLNSQTPPQGQVSAINALLELQKQHGFALQACIANSIRRGILDSVEAKRYDQGHTLLDNCQLVGLGEMTEACHSSDRIMTFA